MALKSQGHITVATSGTPVRVSTTTGNAGVRCHAVFIQQLVGNTGDIHIGISASMDPSDGTDMLATLPIPTVNALPSYSAGVDWAAAGVDLGEIWLDVSVNGEAALVSFIEA